MKAAVEVEPENFARITLIMRTDLRLVQMIIG
jgi:hypothetical protein